MTRSITHSISTKFFKRTDVLFIASQTENNSDGGLESSTKIFESLADRFDWAFVTTRNSNFTRRWTAAGAAVGVAWQFADDTKVGRALNYVAFAFAILVMALRLRPKVIHFNDTKAFKAAELVAWFLDAPILVSLRDTKAPGERYDAPHWKRLAAKAKRIVVLSSSMADYMVEHLAVPSERLCVINSIVDENWFSKLSGADRAELRIRLGLREDEFAVGIIGAVRPKKNQLTLFRYLDAYPERVQSPVVLHVLGDFRPEKDSYARQCKELAAGSNLADRIFFHGHQASMQDWYRALDAVAIASLNEGLARAMIEAMACGTPVVSFDVSSAHEILVESGAGAVVPQGDYAALFDALATLEADAEVRRSSSKKGRAFALARFSSAEVAQSYERLYSELIDP
ncbi:RfaG Glycosyltransferase [Sphingomonadaceae bacterium]